MPPHGLGCCTQGAAQIVDQGVRSGILSGDQTGGFDNRRIARNRSFDHVGEHPDNFGVECKVADLCQGLCK